jgi:putative spermidine/putrescine transport system substrate-binding protein
VIRLNKKILAVGVVIVLVICSVGVGLLYSDNSSKTNTPADFTSAELQNMTWGDILQKARGETVNWYMWGGDSNTNNFVTDQVAKEAANYGITLNEVPLTDIKDGINKVTGEKQAGVDSGGSVDLMWINGANYATMKQGDLLFGPWADNLPNTVLVNWSAPSINTDMGYPVKGYESPWGTAQFQMIYDSAKYNVSELPHDYAELKSWAAAHPGQFTYDALPDFFGTTFIKEAMYELTGGYQQYQSANITLDQFTNMSAPLWSYLSDIKPYLWDNGKTYPSSISTTYSMLNNGQIGLAMTFGGAGIEPMIKNGQLPATAKVYCMNTSIANTNYVAIPYNANAKAGAMVVANILLEPQFQADFINLTGNGPSIDVNNLTGWRAADISNVMDGLPAGTYVPQSELAATSAPDVSGYLANYLQTLWDAKINTG